MNPLSKFQHAAKNLPSSGGGGCHTALLGAANHGVRTGLSDEEVFKILKKNIHGSRHVSDQEMWAAIERARFDYENPDARTSVKLHSQHSAKRQTSDKIQQGGIRIDGDAFILKMMEQAHDKYGAISNRTLLKLSPVALKGESENDALCLLNSLYKPDDVLFIGDTYSKVVKTMASWVENPDLTGCPHIIPNPLTGKIGRTKSGKDSYRCDDCVRIFRYAVVEFDSRPREEQLAFWLTTRLPVCAVIDSGGKSLHGWVRVDIPDRQAWETQIEQMLFSILTQIGTDPACKNEARLSRLPGHFRKEKNAYQRLLYLSPEGVPPCQR